jgi:hypothetical protein
MALAKTRYNMLTYKYTYSIAGVYFLSLISSFKLTNMSFLGKIAMPHVCTYFIYKYLKREGDRKNDDLTKELYFQVDEKYKRFRYTGDIRELGNHVELLEWSELRKKLVE